MNILHMKYAVEVAKVGSLNKAAESLYVALPNISRSIKELEADLGITVFDRTAKGMVLTPEGEVIPGLYAAGETAGTSVGGHGYTGYITGHGLLAALTFGRIAGRDVADFVAGK